MIFGSVCSGIEAASCAWHPLGWKTAFVSEIDKFPCKVLAHHYPNVPNLGDMTKFKDWPDATINVLVGGTPCQSFSVAGLRKGLDDPRGNLMLTYLAIAERYAPRWLVWENVPGVLSSNGGRDFGTLLGGLAKLGYGFAYRVLDAQYIRVESHARAVPQRRRRVFVVGYLGDWRRAAAVLFERESLLGHPAPRRETGKGIARAVAPCLTSRYGKQPDSSDTNAGPMLIPLVARSLTTSNQRICAESETLLVANCLRAQSNSAHRADIDTYIPIAFDCKASGRNGFGVGDIASTMRSMGHSNSHQNGGGHLAVAHPFTLAIRGRGDSHDLEYRQDGTANAVLTPNGGRGGIGVGAVAFDLQQITSAENHSRVSDELPAPTMAKASRLHVANAYAVRRLTPIECERLQAFPDAYTALPSAADGPRYKALGNSMAVSVMSWIGQRIQMVEDLTQNLEVA